MTQLGGVGKARRRRQRRISLTLMLGQDAMTQGLWCTIAGQSRLIVTPGSLEFFLKTMSATNLQEQDNLPPQMPSKII